MRNRAIIDQGKQIGNREDGRHHRKQNAEKLALPGERLGIVFDLEANLRDVLERILGWFGRHHGHTGNQAITIRQQLIDLIA